MKNGQNAPPPAEHGLSNTLESMPDPYLGVGCCARSYADRWASVLPAYHYVFLIILLDIRPTSADQYLEINETTSCSRALTDYHAWWALWDIGFLWVRYRDDPIEVQKSSGPPLERS